MHRLPRRLRQSGDIETRDVHDRKRSDQAPDCADPHPHAPASSNPAGRFVKAIGVGPSAACRTSAASPVAGVDVVRDLMLAQSHGQMVRPGSRLCLRVRA